MLLPARAIPGIEILLNEVGDVRGCKRLPQESFGHEGMLLGSASCQLPQQFRGLVGEGLDVAKCTTMSLEKLQESSKFLKLTKIPFHR